MMTLGIRISDPVSQCRYYASLNGILANKRREMLERREGGDTQGNWREGERDKGGG